MILFLLNLMYFLKLLRKNLLIPLMFWESMLTQSILIGDLFQQVNLMYLVRFRKFEYNLLYLPNVIRMQELNHLLRFIQLYQFIWDLRTMSQNSETEPQTLLSLGWEHTRLKTENKCLGLGHLMRLMIKEIKEWKDSTMDLKETDKISTIISKMNEKLL